MLIIFDLDGTLFQAKPAVLEAARRLLCELGVSVPGESAILQGASRGTAALLRNILPDGSDMAAAFARYGEILAETVGTHGALYPGALDSITELYADGHELVVCSNSEREYIGSVLERFGLDSYICKYFSAGAAKAEVISRLTASCKTAVVVGDTHGDIEAAAACGLPGVAAMYGYGNKALLAGATEKADTAFDIVRCIRSLRVMKEV